MVPREKRIEAAGFYISAGWATVAESDETEMYEERKSGFFTDRSLVFTGINTNSQTIRASGQKRDCGFSIRLSILWSKVQK